MARRSEGQFPAFSDPVDAATLNRAFSMLDRRLTRLEQAIQKGYSVAGTFTARRALNGQTGTATEVREVLATLMQDALTNGIIEK